MPLPKGFTLDQPDQATAANGLPKGFTLDGAPATAEAPKERGMLDSVGDFVSGAASKLNPAAMLQGVAEMTVHPIDTARNMLQAQANAGGKAYESFKKGNMVEGLRHAIGYALPVVGPEIDAMGDKAGNGQIAEAMGEAAGFGLVNALPVSQAGATLARGATRGLRSIGRGVSTAATEVLGQTTGAGGAAMKQALKKSSPDLVNAMRGTTTEPEVLAHFKDALQGVKDKRGAAYQADLAKLPKDVQLDLTHSMDTLKAELAKHNVKIGEKGALDFSRSAIRDKIAQSEVRGIYEDMQGWGSQADDLTPAGVDILKRRIDDSYSTSSTARAFVQSTKDAVRKDLTTQVPGYGEMTKKYADASQFLDQLRDLSLESRNPGTAIRKLTTTLKQNNGYREALTDALGEYTQVDLRGELAGMNLSKYPPRGLAGPSTGFGILFGLSQGILTPVMALSMGMASPRLMGELLTAMSKVKPGAGGARAAAGAQAAAASGRVLPIAGNAAHGQPALQPAAGDTQPPTELRNTALGR